MLKSILLLFTILFLLVNCKKENLDPGNFDSEYPTKYCFIGNGKRQELNNSIANDSYLFLMEVDSFGFFERSPNESIPASVFEGYINNQDSVLILAKTFLEKYSALTGVKDTSKLVLKNIRGFWAGFGGKYVPRNGNDKNRWFVQFEEQMFYSYKVYGTTIGVYVSPGGVYEIFGNWFPEIYLPLKERISFSEAKEKMVGKTLEYSDWGGRKEHKITLEDFYDDDQPDKIIFPLKQDGCIEMRVCWFIESKTLWNFYVDVITGELIFNEQTIIF